MRNSVEKIRGDFRAMGTDVSVEIWIRDRSDQAEFLRAQEATKKIQEIFFEQEKKFSRFDAQSELSKINLCIGKRSAVSAEMSAVLALCIKFYKLSDGYFDPRIIGVLESIGYNKDFRNNNLSTHESKDIKLEEFNNNLEEDLILDADKGTVLLRKRIDTTGIAKGFTVDKAAEYLESEGWENFIVDAGGDMYAKGRSGINQSWEVGIEGLDDRKISLKLQDEGIATSGISRKRWRIGEKKVHHLINPKSPESFSHDIKTVTVIADKTVEADGRAKVLVLMGREKGLAFANENNIKAAFLDYRGNVYLSKSIRENIVE